MIFFKKKAKIQCFLLREKQIAQRKKEHREKRRSKAQEGGLINAGSLSQRSNTEEDVDRSYSSVVVEEPINLGKKEEKKKEEKKNNCAC